MRQEKENVRAFYDTFGWHESEEGLYTDTSFFVDWRPVVRAYDRKVRLRVKRFLKPKGQYFLDAASGPIPHPEYMSYSSNYRLRICVDLSVKALQEARAKLGDRGAYVLADVTKLPFKNGVFDTVLSAHTIYHVPADEQLSAILEFERTLKNSGTCVVIYTWPSKFIDHIISGVKRFRRSGRPIKRILRQMIKRTDTTASADRSSAAEPQKSLPPIYSHAHDHGWFKTNLPKNWNVELRCWSLIDTRFTKAVVTDNRIGKFLLQTIFCIEDIFPRLTARLGRYPMFIIRKH